MLSLTPDGDQASVTLDLPEEPNLGGHKETPAREGWDGSVRRLFILLLVAGAVASWPQHGGADRLASTRVIVTFRQSAGASEEAMLHKLGGTVRYRSIASSRRWRSSFFLRRFLPSAPLLV